MLGRLLPGPRWWAAGGLGAPGCCRWRSAAREAEIERREQEIEQRERAVAIRERRLAEVEPAGGALDGWQPPKLGRNEPCWCESGKKFKYCHGGLGT